MIKSKALFKDSSAVLAGGVNSPVRAFRAVGGTPIFLRSGSGAHIQDADGRRYIDYCLSWGPLILGHAHPKVVAAAHAALKAGSSFGAPTEGELRLAEAIQAALPSMQRMRFTSSGTEAVMSAIRVARAFTGRDLIVKFAGGYHGHVDSLLVAAGSGATTLGRPDSAGVPKAWAETTLTVPYNDAKALAEAFRKWGRRIAAVIVEPVAANMGVVPPEEGFLEAARTLTKKHKSLLIFDEVVTGFRLFYGGAQTAMKIAPDLTCLGKIIGGGFPLGAYGGRRDIMDLVAPLGPVYQAGTLSGNPVATAAGLATLDVLREEKPYARMAQLTAVLVMELRGMARIASLPVTVNHMASMLTVFFTGDEVRDYASAKTADAKAYARFFHALLARGVYFPPAQFEAAMLSSKHSAADVERTLDAAARAFKRL
ncbi:MAG TPA: glutamate-1-semialdehyde 2,1-aminomutase [Elusimicrobiota bacterium]|jgi:glutamate-1-semialdehyde 2,1-aminomutase|nr:glutamate-1-semialdehyde 2,1-aminomutase [Elusimicrobiota bacterium]